MALSTADKKLIWTEMMRLNKETFGFLTKDDLLTAFDDVDQWVEDNQSAFNTAISEPARSELNAKQKSYILSLVLRKRFEIS